MKKLAGAVLLVALTAANTASGATFLQMPGIPGESTVKSREGWIDLRSFSLQFSNGVCNGLSVSKHLDKASPALSAAAVAGQMFETATLAVTKENSIEEYLRVTLQQAVVTGLSLEGPSDALPAEIVSLRARTITMVYRQQNPDGSLGPVIESTIACP